MMEGGNGGRMEEGGVEKEESRKEEEVSSPDYAVVIHTEPVLSRRDHGALEVRDAKANKLRGGAV